MRRTRIRAASAATIVVAGLVAIVVGSVSTARADQPPLSALCGIEQAVDNVLGCTRAPTASSSPQAPQSAGATTTAAAAPAAQPASKLAPNAPVARIAMQPTFVPNVLLVRFRDGVSRGRATALLSKLGVHTAKQIAQIDFRVISVKPSQRGRVLAALAASPLVETAHRDEVMHVMRTSPNDAFYSFQWGIRRALFPTASGRAHSARTVVVAVVDTGVDASQPDLAGAVLPGVNLVNGDASSADDNGHGTSVAGVIAALADNGVGGSGVCGSCSILPIKVMGADGNGDLATVAAGIVRATDMGARVIDLSLGGPAGMDALKQAVDYANSKGVLVVAAAGNSGQGMPFYPAGYANVLSVGASDKLDHLYPWSEHGSWVLVTAPGCNVVPKLHGGYGNFCGTSSATPLAAGLAGLMLAQSPHATSTQVIAAVQRTARRIKTGVRFGRIDATAALRAVPH
jgi:subtilisin family serine protease